MTLQSVYPPEVDQHLTPEEAVAVLDAWVNQWNYPPLLKPKGLGRRVTTERSISMSWRIKVTGDKVAASAALQTQREEYAANHRSGLLNDKQWAIVEAAAAFLGVIIDAAPEGVTLDLDFSGHTDSGGAVGVTGTVVTSRPPEGP